MSLIVTLVVAVAIATAYVLWRAGPIIFGAGRAGHSRTERLARWNQFIVPLLHKSMEAPLAVARCQFFESTADGRTYTIATWSMVPSVLPDVDFVALARPGGDEDDPEIVAVAEAPALRALLGGHVENQTMWGHSTWIHIWPDEIDLDAVVAKLTPVDAFHAQHGMSAERVSERPPPG